MSDKLIESAYEMLSTLTPLKHDCGKDCDKACCVSDGSMLLFPYEYDLLKSKDYKFTKYNLEVLGEVWAMTCSGECDRELRPLSCRIFPLAPKITKGEIFLRLDARGRSVCPLTHKSILSLDKKFVDVVKKTLIMLSCDDKIAQYLTSISKLTDKYMEIIL